MKKLVKLFALFSILVFVGCGAGTGSGEEIPSKDSLLSQGKADGVDLCQQLGFESDCDFCVEFGWYGDGSCDTGLYERGLCKEADTEDCEAEVTLTTISFPVEGQPTVDGSLQAGQTIVVDYDYHRLIDSHPECIQKSPYGEVVQVVMGAMINDDTETIEYYRYVSGYSTTSYASVKIENEITLPEDAELLDLWFYCTEPPLNDIYDSNYGDNYVFEVN